jgi:hypothetical protein
MQVKSQGHDKVNIFDHMPQKVILVEFAHARGVGRRNPAHTHMKRGVSYNRI